VANVQRSTRRRAYFGLMCTCVLLILLAWNVVRLWSTTAAVVMSVVAAVIPPVAAIVGNLGSLDDSQLPSGDRQERVRFERDPDR
jgi:hypothetical protein